MSAMMASAVNAQEFVQVEVAIASDILEKVFVEIQASALRIDRPQSFTGLRADSAPRMPSGTPISGLSGFSAIARSTDAM